METTLKLGREKTKTLDNETSDIGTATERRQHLSVVADELVKALSSTQILSSKTQNFHWNVEGANFAALHALFQQQYGDLNAATDELAERIRALGFKTPATLRFYQQNSILEDAPERELSDREMIRILHDDHERISRYLNEAAQIADDENDRVSVSLFDERAAVHQKAAWMLRSLLA